MDRDYHDFAIKNIVDISIWDIVWNGLKLVGFEIWFKSIEMAQVPSGLLITRAPIHRLKYFHVIQRYIKNILILRSQYLILT